jgi:hypothetical protein
MDPATLVDGGIEGLHRIVDVLEANDVPVSGAYLIKLTSEDGYEDIVFRVATTMQTHPFVFILVQLKREGKLPRIDDRVRIDAVSESSDEASRILKYAAQAGAPVVKIRGAGLNGLYVDEAIVVKWPKKQVAVA